MEVKNSTVLKFRPNQVIEVRNSLNYSDVSRLEQDLDILEEWLKKQNHFVVREFDRNYLERFLVNNKGSVEKTKKRIDKLFTLRTLLPEMCLDFDVKNEFEKLLDVSSQCVLPTSTEDCYRIFISKIHHSNADGVDIMSFFRYITLIVEYLMMHDYCAGYEYIADIRDIKVAVLIMKSSPIALQKATSLMEAYGVRIKRLHFVSSSSLLEKFVLLLKQGLSEKLRDRIHIHTSVESLYEFLPKKLLPEDLGGEQKSIRELSENMRKEIMSDENIQWIRLFETYKADESMRLSSKFNEEYSGMPGSFKTLCVD